MIRLFQFLIACSVLAGVGYFILQDMPPEDESDKYKFVAMMYKPESEEYRKLYDYYSSLEDMPMPVGSWESQAESEFHYLLKVNGNGGFVLSINPHANDHSEGAVTGVLTVTGSAFRAHHVVGTAKHFIPKSGHIVVKQYKDNELQLLHPQTLQPINFIVSG